MRFSTERKTDMANRETQMLVDSIESNHGRLLYYGDTVASCVRSKGKSKTAAINAVAENLKARYDSLLSDRFVDPFFKAVVEEALEKVDFKEAARQIAELAGGLD